MGQAASKAATTLSKASNRLRGDAPRKSFEYNPTRGQGPDAPKLPEKMQEMPDVSFVIWSFADGVLLNWP
jgi:hypothetical protein